MKGLSTCMPKVMQAHNVFGLAAMPPTNMSAILPYPPSVPVEQYVVSEWTIRSIHNSYMSYEQMPNLFWIEPIDPNLQ